MHSNSLNTENTRSPYELKNHNKLNECGSLQTLTQSSEVALHVRLVFKGKKNNKKIWCHLNKRKIRFDHKERMIGR